MHRFFTGSHPIVSASSIFHTTDCTTAAANVSHTTDLATPGASAFHTTDCTPPGASIFHTTDCAPPGAAISHSTDCATPPSSISHSTHCAPQGESISHTTDYAIPTTDLNDSGNCLQGNQFAVSSFMKEKIPCQLKHSPIIEKNCVIVYSVMNLLKNAGSHYIICPNQNNFSNAVNHQYLAND